VSDAELQQWAESHSEGPVRSPVAVRVLQLLRLQDAARTAVRYLRYGDFGDEKYSAMNVLDGEIYNPKS